jgi:hypothetical protein
MLPSSRTALRLSGLSATDALPNRNAISKVPRAAGYRVAISSPGTEQATFALQRIRQLLGGEETAALQACGAAGGTCFACDGLILVAGLVLFALLLRLWRIVSVATWPTQLGISTLAIAGEPNSLCLHSGRSFRLAGRAR